jgi:hypothetical protein
MTLLGGAAVAWPLAAWAQQPERMRHIGVLLPFFADDAESQTRMGAFLQTLAVSGWTIGRNVRIDTRWGAVDAERIRSYAAELIALAPDVIVATGSAAVGRRQGRKLDAAAVEERVGGDEKGVEPFAHKDCEGRIDLVIAARVEHLTLQPDGACSFRYVS